MAKHKWLVLILSVAALFRFLALTKAPPALNWDEVSIGYNAYSVLKTGADEWGSLLPLSFRAFGEHKLPGMIYASIPGIAIFGLSELGVRVTPAVLGLLAVYLVYLLSKELFRDDSLALFSSALMAVSPWAIHFSRAAFEAGLALCLTLLSLLFLARSRQTPRYLWASMIAAVFSAYTYNSVRLLLPILFAIYLFSGYLKPVSQHKKTFLAVILTGLLLSLPIFAELANPEGRVRLGTVALNAHKGFRDGIAESRGYTTLSSPLPQLIHNKYTHYAYQFSLNYLKTFSTEFLYLTGSSNSQRSVQGMGLMYLFELPLLVLGLSKLKRYQGAYSLVLPLLLLSPIPSAITIDAPSSLRALSLLPALVLVEALGISSVVAWLAKHSLARYPLALFVLWSIGYFSYQLWYVNPVKYSDAWQYGYKQAVLFAQDHYDRASRIYLTAKYGEPYIFTLFYTAYDPARFQAEPVDRSVDPTGWVHVNGFDKYHFTNFSGLDEPAEIVSRNHGELVMITGFAQLPPDYHRDLSIQAPNWKIMFEGTVQEGRQ